jgi:hypothetical protein
MNNSDFQKQFLGTFEISKKERVLYELSQWYHETCETFDRTICSGPIVDGSIRPVDGFELGIINRNALKAKKECIKSAGRYDITKEEMVKAIQNYK